MNTDPLEAANLNRIETEARKLEAEIRKLEGEIAETRGSQLRGWIVSVSVVVGIAVSVFGVYNTLTEIASRNRQLALETQVRSHEIFLNQVLDRMSGIKVVHREVNSKTGELALKSQDAYAGVIQVGSYGSAVSLACRFDNLRLAAESALAYQLAVNPTDISAKNMLQRIKGGCPSGWDQLTEQEEQEESERFRAAATRELLSAIQHSESTKDRQNAAKAYQAVYRDDLASGIRLLKNEELAVNSTDAQRRLRVVLKMLIDDCGGRTEREAQECADAARR